MNINIRIIIILCVIVVIIASYISCSNIIADDNGNVDSGKPVDTPISIVHINSLRGKVFSDDHEENPNIKIGGINLIASKVNDIDQSSNTKSIKIANSNFLYGSPETFFTQGECVVDYLNLLDFSAMIIGHREFYFGQDRLKELSQKAKFPFLSCNIVYEDTNTIPEYIRPYHIVERNNVRIGIIGFSTPLVIINTKKEQSHNLKILHIQNSVLKYVREIASNVSHIYVFGDISFGGDDDVTNDIITSLLEIDEVTAYFFKTNNEELLKATAGKALIYNKDLRKVGVYFVSEDGLTIGHYSRISNKKSKDELNDYHYLREKESEDYKLYNIISTEISPDVTIAESLNTLKKRILKVNSRIIARAKDDISHSFSSESPLGNLVNDAIIDYTKSDISVINSGGLRYGFKKGLIKLFDINRALPFKNQLVEVLMTGEQVLKLLEASCVFRHSKSFLQVSGIEFQYDSSQTPSNRVIKEAVKVNGEPLSLTKVYKVACSKFVYEGGDGYSEFKDMDIKMHKVFNLIEKEVVTNYLIEKHDVDAKVEGRIVDIRGLL